jgi:outer membrane receptor protein involved in Fe transport
LLYGPACRKKLLASVAVVPLIFGAVTKAQTQAQPAGGQPAAGGGIEEIIVTSTRRAQALSKVTESVSAFTASKMQDLNIKSFADIAKFTPGVIFNEARHDISIRGVASQAGSGTTGIYIDDTPIQVRALGFNANNTLPTVFDIDRVEVLRGPQGTLFGAGSEGGTVRYITRQPSLTDYTGLAHAELSGTETGGINYEAGAAFGGPIVDDKLGFRLSGWARRDAGWIDKIDPYTGQTTDTDANRVNTYVVRAALAWQPIDNLTITPSYNFQQRAQNNYDQYWRGLGHPGDGVFYDATPEHMEDPDRFQLGAVKIEYDTDDFQIISNTSYYSRNERLNGYSGSLYNLSYFQQIIYGHTDPQGNPCTNDCRSFYPLLGPASINLPGFGRYESKNWITNTQRNITQEARIQSADPDAWLTWVGGVFYAENAQRSTEEINDPQLPQLTRYLWNEDMITAWGMNLLPNGDDYINDTAGSDSQVALFGDVTVKILDNLKATVGLRYAWTHYDFHNLNDGAQDLLDNGGFPNKTSGQKDETPVTPKFGLSYNFTPDDMIYTTIAKGYRIGGASPPLPVVACGGEFPTSYNSDTTWSYEVGTKNRMLDGTLQIAASAYHIDWSNIQQAIIVTQCAILYTTNVGNATSDGFDFQADWQATSNLAFDFSAGYTDAKYSDNVIDPTSTSGQLLAQKGDSIGTTDSNPSPWTISVGAQYNFQVDDDPAFFRVDYEYESRRHRPLIYEDPATRYFDPYLRPDQATHQLAFRAGITMNNLELNLFMENVLNSRPQLDFNHEDKYTQLITAETLRPRTTGISMTYKY